MSEALSGVVAIAGPPCSGKTSVGRVLSLLTGAAFFDLDMEVERSCGLTVPEIFSVFGETRFRVLERAALESVLARGGSLVVALGGGTLLNQGNLDLVLRSAVIVTLDAPPGILADRLDGLSRPLSADRECFEALLDSRREHYGSLPNRVDCTGGSVEECARLIVRLLRGESAGLDGMHR